MSFSAADRAKTGKPRREGRTDDVAWPPPPKMDFFPCGGGRIRFGTFCTAIMLIHAVGLNDDFSFDPARAMCHHWKGFFGRLESSRECMIKREDVCAMFYAS